MGRLKEKRRLLKEINEAKNPQKKEVKISTKGKSIVDEFIVENYDKIKRDIIRNSKTIYKGLEEMDVLNLVITDLYGKANDFKNGLDCALEFYNRIEEHLKKHRSNIKTMRSLSKDKSNL